MLINTLAGSIVRLVAIWFFMPVWGVSAYIYAVISGSIVTIALNFKTISKLTGISIDIGDWIMKPLTASLTGSVLALLLKQLSVFAGLPRRLALLAVCITFSLIIIIFLIMGIIKGEDLKRWTGKHNIISNSIIL